MEEQVYCYPLGVTNYFDSKKITNDFTVTIIQPQNFPGNSCQFF